FEVDDPVERVESGAVGRDVDIRGDFDAVSGEVHDALGGDREGGVVAALEAVGEAALGGAGEDAACCGGQGDGLAGPGGGQRGCVEGQVAPGAEQEEGSGEAVFGGADAAIGGVDPEVGRGGGECGGGDEDVAAGGDLHVRVAGARGHGSREYPQCCVEVELAGGDLAGACRQLDAVLAAGGDRAAFQTVHEDGVGHDAHAIGAGQLGEVA